MKLSVKLTVSIQIKSVTYLKAIKLIVLYKTQYIQQYIKTLSFTQSSPLFFCFHQMQLQTIPPIQKITFQSPKNKKKNLNDSFRADTQKFHHTQNSEEECFYHQKFTKTHFKAKIKQLNSSKYSIFENDQSRGESMSLQKIEEKLKKYAICSYGQKQFLLTKAQMLKFPGLQTAKNKRFKSPQGDSAEEQRLCSEDIHQRQLTLKKRINMIKKHKEVIQKQFQERKASLEYNQRFLSKQEYRLYCYRSKFEKVRTVREQRSREKIENSLEIAVHNQQVLRRNNFLKSTVIDSQENLKSSRISLCMQKLKLANQTRAEKHLNMEELKSSQNQTLKQKKQQCEQVKKIKAQTHKSVEECNKNRIVTVNQRKLQEISKELLSLQHQNKIHNIFYRIKQVNDSYQNKIKYKKKELQQKAKVYKANLMLELNKSQRIIKNEQEEHMLNVRNSSITEVYRKKDQAETSTAPDMNFASTKSNSIYKRWNNPMAAQMLKPNLLLEVIP